MDRAIARAPGTIERIAGADLTDALDCNVYVVYGRDEALLVDTGTGRASFDVPTEVATAIVTHLHADHSAGAAALARAGLVILAHPWTAAGLMSGDEERAGLDRARTWGMYPSDQRLEPCPHVRAIDDGLRLDLGGCVVHVVSTPGHSSGHLSLLVESDDDRRSLVAGDLVFPGGTISLQVMPDCHIESLWQSIEQVRAFEPDALYAGHLAPVENDATSHLDSALAEFRSGRIPRSHD
jgi:glyoxylase-like metal-dependent hydrolase (beta-lactamase superfamily II)